MPVYDEEKIVKPHADPAELAQPESAASSIAASEKLTTHLTDEKLDTADQKEKLDSDELNKAEQDSSKESGEESPSFFRENSQPKKAKGNKKMLFAAGGLGGVVMIGIVLFVFLSSLLIPNLAQHITEYQSVRLTRQFAENAQRATGEKLAIESIADDAAYKSVKDRFIAAGEKSSTLWEKLDQYRPSKVIENLEANNGLAINTTTTFTGRLVVHSVLLNNNEYFIKQLGFERYLPGFKQFVDFKNGVNFSKDFAPALDTALRANDVGTVVRSSTAKQIRQKLGIGLTAWTVGKYKGKSANEARLAQTREKVTKIDQTTITDSPKTSTIRDAESAANDAKNKTLNDDKLLQNTIDNSGIAKNVESSVRSTLTTSGLQETLGVVNSVYAIAMPICIVYDGSLEQSGPAIDNQTRQQQAAYYYLASAADQQKFGETTPEAVGALNDDLNSTGDISQSNPEIRAGGGRVNTGGVPSVEASASGQYTLNDALFGGTIASTLNTVADSACPVFTNIPFAVGVSVVNIVAGVFSGGASTVGEKAAGEAASKLIKNQLKEKLISSVSKDAVKGLPTRAKGLLFSTTKSAAIISAETVIAKFIVMNRAGQTNSGFAQGKDLVNQADSGGNIVYGEVSRQGLYGRPLNQNEVVTSKAADQQYAMNQVSKENAYERYASLSNSHSLVSKLGMTFVTHTSGSIFSSIFSSLGKITNIFSAIPKVFSSLTTKPAIAADVVNNSDYGNIQFGWSEDEEKLINSSTSYLPLENQNVLDKTGQIKGKNANDYFNDTYGKCFTSSLGTLLSSGEIKRDANGNVLDTGDNEDCSPRNLSMHNALYGDLVFRWRLAMSYNNTINDLTQMQGTSK